MSLKSENSLQEATGTLKREIVFKRLKYKILGRLNHALRGSPGLLYHGLIHFLNRNTGYKYKKPQRSFCGFWEDCQASPPGRIDIYVIFLTEIDSYMLFF